MALVRRRPPPGVTPDPPAAGQESVWDYPRPPRVEPTSRAIRVEAHGTTIAESSRALRVLETSLAPSYYIPADDVEEQLLAPVAGRTVCEWKGTAEYYDVTVQGTPIRRAAWRYPHPNPAFRGIAGHYSFYPDLVTCSVDGEAARAQPGGFYGGWITSHITGPFKGAPGTRHW